MGWRQVCLTLITGILAVPAVAASDDEKLLGNWRDWNAMRYAEGNGKIVCVAWSDPKSRVSARRGETHAFVSHRTGGRIFHEVSVQLGKKLKVGSIVTARVGEQRFTLYTDGDSAWNNALKEDLRMIRAMRAGVKLEIAATAADGTRLADTYSLFGFTDAHKRVNEECGAK